MTETCETTIKCITKCDRCGLEANGTALDLGFGVVFYGLQTKIKYEGYKYKYWDFPSNKETYATTEKDLYYECYVKLCNFMDYQKDTLPKRGAPL